MSNYVDKQGIAARKRIDEILMETLPRIKDGIPINEVVRQISLSFAVNPTSIKNFILIYYVELGHVELNENILFKKLVSKTKKEEK